MALIVYVILLGFAFLYKKEIHNFWHYWKTNQQVKNEKSFFKDIAGLASLDLWTGIIVLAVFFWLPREMVRKSAEEITIHEFIVFSLFEELVFRILPWLTLWILIKVRKYNKEEKNRLDYAIGIFTSLGFGLLHAFNFADPIAALPLCISQIVGGLTLWYLQRRYFVGASAIYHLSWNLMFKLL